MDIIKKFKIGNNEYAIAMTYPWDYKICGVCGKVTMKGTYCMKCGSSQIITRMRKGDDVTRKRDRTVGN